MENLTNEQKANEICMNIVPPYTDFIHQNYKTAMKMAKWKDEQFKKQEQQLIDKACDTIKNLLGEYIIRYFHSGDSYNLDKLINDFKQTMRGE